MVAALAVLVSHSFPLAAGPGTPEPLQSATGFTLGTWAVLVFFFSSGLLVSASWVRSRDLARFAIARLLRILPGLGATAVFTTFVLGLLFTSERANDFVVSAAVWEHFSSHAVGIPNSQRLPGVFESNPYPLTTNGSLWTIRFELIMYIGLGLLARLGRLGLESRVPAGLAGFLYAGLVLAGALLGDPRGAFWERLIALGSWFAVGAIVLVARHALVLRADAAVVLAVLLTAVASADPSPALFHAVLLLTLPYIVLYVAYGLQGGLVRLAPSDDISYGIYTYAFPIQQSIAATLPGIGVGSMMASSLATTLIMATISRRAVELPALRLRSKLSRRSRYDLSLT